MPNKYYPKNIVRISTSLTASGNLMINPTSVYASVFFDSVSSINPSSVINPSCGFFYHDYEVNTPGILGYRWLTDGSHKSQSFGALSVNSVPFA